MNYIHQLNGFWEKVSGENLNTSSVVLYMALLHVCNNTGWKVKFNSQRDYLLHLSKIGSVHTYYAAIKELTERGFIKYEKGINPKTAATFEIVPLFRSNNATQGATQQNQYSNNDMQGATQTATQGATIHKPINNKPINNKLDIDHIDFSKANFDNLKDAANDLHDTTDHPRTIPIAQTEKYPFEEFWSLYDKKVGKQKAEKLYSKTTLAERERIMTKHLPYYLKQQPDSKFRKHPEGYLNQKLFNDEIPEETAAAAPEQIWFPKFPHLHKKQA